MARAAFVARASHLSERGTTMNVQSLMFLTPFVRIFLFSAGSWLVSRGLVDQETADRLTADPEVLDHATIGVQAMLGVACYGGTAAWYALARIFDWER